MRKDKLFSWYTLILTVGGVAVNLLLSKLVLCFELPLFLDSVGTILAGALGGYLPGILVGFLSNAINSIQDPITLYYGVVSILIAVVAAYMSKRGCFKKAGWTILSVFIFAVAGGVLGSVMTWALYGLNIGTGISAPFAVTLAEQTSLSDFMSQLTADFIIDVIDKIITVAIVELALWLLPQRFLLKLPQGYAYARRTRRQKKAEADAAASAVQGAQSVPLVLSPDMSDAPEGIKKLRRISIKEKVMLLIIVTAVVLSAIAITISATIYEQRMNERYTEKGEVAVTLMCEALSGDEVKHYLETGTADARYYDMRDELEMIADALPDIKYMYVARDYDDGSHVIFDLDTAETPASLLGDVWDFDQTFLPYKEQLIAGEDIPAVVSNDQYGWLLTVREQIYDSNGQFVAYAEVDISMADVIADRYVFIIRMVALLFEATMIIVAFALWFSQRKMAEPIDALTAAASRFAYDSEENRQRNTQSLRELNIKTGDEIEALYLAMRKTTEDVDEYIKLIDEKTADVTAKAALIAQLQDNIILAFANMVENRDELTGSHIKRTAAYVTAIATQMQAEGTLSGETPGERVENLSKSAPLHDIGKVRVSDTILNKPGRLTESEFDTMKTHTVIGRQILSGVLKDIEEDNYLSVAMDMAGCHHERWDGKGYPNGLAGRDIPISARIMALADVFDALVSKRSYKEAYSFEQAMEIIQKESGTHFDPDVVKAFLAVKDEIREISQKQ